jgi:hypothetical protein
MQKKGPGCDHRALDVSCSNRYRWSDECEIAITHSLHRKRLARKYAYILQATNDLVTSIASKNVNTGMDEQMSFGDKLADKAADFVGSWTFLIWYLAGVLVWSESEIRTDAATAPHKN